MESAVRWGKMEGLVWRWPGTGPFGWGPAGTQGVQLSYLSSFLSIMDETMAVTVLLCPTAIKRGKNVKNELVLLCKALSPTCSARLMLA